MVSGTGANFEPQVYMNRASLAVLLAQVYDKVVAMAAERGTSASEVVEDLAEDASLEAATAEEVLAQADELADVRDEIKKELLDKVSDEVKENFESRSEEFDQFVKTLSKDMSDEDVAKAVIELKEYDELFGDIIDSVTE